MNYQYTPEEIGEFNAEIERLRGWNHDRLQELKDREIEIERLRAALKVETFTKAIMKDAPPDAEVPIWLIFNIQSHLKTLTSS